MSKTMKSLALLGVAMGLVTVAVSSRAAALDGRTTFLTFNRPVALPGVALGTGTYIFELAAPMSNREEVPELPQSMVSLGCLKPPAPVTDQAPSPWRSTLAPNWRAA